MPPRIRPEAPESLRPSALKDRLLLIAVLLIGAWLRIDVLTQAIRFHPDEALFATFARDAAVHGQWMFPGALDKPPLSLYAAALSMHGVGVFTNSKGVLDLDLPTGELAARLPSVWAGIVSIALTYTLARTLTRRRDAALIAALLMALSPFHAAFSATAFTDPLMLACGLASLVMAARGRPLWAGVWLALAVWSKQQGVFLLPLSLWLVMFSHRSCPTPKNPHLNPPPLTGEDFFAHSATQYPSFPSVRATDAPAVESKRDELPTTDFYRRGEGVKFSFRSGGGLLVIHLLVAFLLGVGLLFVWDAVRASTFDAASLFTQAAVNNNPERAFVRADELLPRLEVWGAYLGTFFGSPLVTMALLLAGLSGLRRVHWPLLVPLMVYSAVYLLAHWLVAFNLYDRYLLPVVPLLAVMVGAGLAQGMSALNRVCGRYNGHGSAVSLQVILMLLVAGVMLLSAYPPRYPTDDRPRDAGIIALADHLNDKPLGAILYDPWLGWELGYYLGPWTDKRRVHYPAPEVLAADALLNPDTAPRYFIAPHDHDIRAWLAALESAGFAISSDWDSPRYVAFELIPP